MWNNIIMETTGILLWVMVEIILSPGIVTSKDFYFHTNVNTALSLQHLFNKYEKVVIDKCQNIKYINNTLHATTSERTKKM